jgi:hypothetical protein
MEEFGLKTLIDLSAQMINMHVDDVIERRLACCIFPDISRQHLPRDNPTLMNEQVFEYFKLPGSQFDCGTPSLNRALRDVDLKIS